MVKLKVKVKMMMMTSISIMTKPQICYWTITHFNITLPCSNAFKQASKLNDFLLSWRLLWCLFFSDEGGVVVLVSSFEELGGNAEGREEKTVNKHSK